MFLTIHRLRLLVMAAALLNGASAHWAEALSRTEPGLLGTICTVTVFDGTDNAALDAAFDRIRQIDERMSASRRDSEVMSVNRAAGSHPVKVSPDTFFVIKEGLAFSRLGNGVFDITVGPLVKLWGIGTDEARVPSESEIARVLPLIDYRSVALSEKDSTVFLRRQGMAIDLGAIGKGYAADEVARLLRERGTTRALINLGGNILTVGMKADGSPWRIGIQDPEKPVGTPLGVLRVPPMSVVTSGSYERFFEAGGVRYHHIFDTATGYPTRSGLLAVAIVTEKSIIADAYSTLVFALGLRKGKELVEATKGAVNAIFVTEGHEVYVTRAIRESFEITNHRYALKGW